MGDVLHGKEWAESDFRRWVWELYVAGKSIALGPVDEDCARALAAPHDLSSYARDVLAKTESVPGEAQQLGLKVALCRNWLHAVAFNQHAFLLSVARTLNDALDDKCGVHIDYEASFMVGDAGYKRDVDEDHPDGRPADDFSNSDRGFAENLGIPFSEPTDYFGWRTWEFYNIRYKSQLEGILDAMDEEIAELTESGADDERLEMLRSEVDSNREINEL